MDGSLLFDFPPDTYSHALQHGLELAKVRTLLVAHSHMDHWFPADLIHRHEHFGHDTGCNLSEEAWKLVTAERCDLISLDAAMGRKTIGGYHMGLPDVESVLKKLAGLGCVDDKTVKAINHFSHNGEMTHDRLAAWGVERGVLAAYDGMEVEF